MLKQYNLNRVLLTVLRAGVFFILFSPLVINNHYFFPFIVPRNIFFRIATEVLFFGWLLLLHVNSNYKPAYKHWNKLVWLVISFFLINVIATIFSLGLYNSFWSNYERMGGLFHFAHLVMFFVVLISVFKDKRDWQIFITFSVFVSTLMSLLAFTQWLETPFLLQSSGGKRLTGTAGNATFLAAYLIFNFFFLIYFLAKQSRFSLKTYFISFVTFDVFLLLSTILSSVAFVANWGWLNFLKTPLLSEIFRRAFSSNEIYTAKDSTSALIVLGAFLLLQGLIFTAWFLKTKTAFLVQILLGILIVFEGFIIYNTQTRGAIIGLAAGFVFLAIASLFSKVNIRIKQVSIAFLISIIVIPVILVGAKNTDFVKNNGTLDRLASISLTDVTTESRLLTWQASWRGMTENVKTFLIGIGPENYYYVFNKNFPQQIYRDAGSQIWFDRAHNIIFDVGVTTGVIGLITYLAILLSVSAHLYLNYKKGQSLSASLIFISLTIAYFIQNIFVFDTLNTDILFYFFLAFVVFLSSSHNSDNTQEDQSNNRSEVNIIYVTGVVAVMIFGIFSLNIKVLQANNYIYQGLVAVNKEENYKEAYDFLKQSVEESVTGRFEARQQLATFVNGLSKNSNIPPEEIIPMINYATEELRKSTVEEPKNVRHYLYLSTFYNATTRFNRSHSQKVIDLLSEAITLSPTRPHIYYEIAQAYAFQNNFDKAYEYFQKGSKFAPTVIEDRWNILTLAIVFEKFDLADEQYNLMRQELTWEPGVEDYKKIVSLYGRVNNFTKMIEYQLALINLQPNPGNYAQLAALYAKLGQNDKAIEATNRAVELDPAFAAEAKIFKEQLEAGELLDN